MKKTKKPLTGERLKIFKQTARELTPRETVIVVGGIEPNCWCTHKTKL